MKRIGVTLAIVFFLILLVVAATGWTSQSTATSNTQTCTVEFFIPKGGRGGYDHYTYCTHNTPVRDAHDPSVVSLREYYSGYLGYCDPNCPGSNQNLSIDPPMEGYTIISCEK